MAKKNIKKGLGRGLSALIPDIDSDVNQIERKLSTGNELISSIPIDKIKKNPYQPRKDFDNEKIYELADSIKKHGLISPITVRKKDDYYELIAGERRLRASKIVGLKEISAYILNIESDKQLLEYAIIENLQREDLNAVEIALSYKQLIDEFNLTQEQVAEQVGKKRSTITNFLRLLKLPDLVLNSLKIEEISSGHARTLLALDDDEKIIRAWKLVKEKNLSVRDTEKLVNEYDKIFSEQSTDSKKKDNEYDDEFLAAIEDNEDSLRAIFGTDVKIKFKNKEKGSIVIDYYSGDDLNRLLEILSKNG